MPPLHQVRKIGSPFVTESIVWPLAKKDHPSTRSHPSIVCPIGSQGVGIWHRFRGAETRLAPSRISRIVSPAPEFNRNPQLPSYQACIVALLIVAVVRRGERLYTGVAVPIPQQ